MHTNVIANAIFGTVSGSAVATAAAVGSTMTPMLKKEGYNPAMAAAVNVAAAPAGMLIPPSNTLIIYSLAAGGTSIGALFMAGYIPGILWALACAAVVFFYARRHPELRGTCVPGWKVVFVDRSGGRFRRSASSSWRSAASSPASSPRPRALRSRSCTRSTLSMIYRTVKVRDLPEILFDACRTSSIVIFLIAVSSIMGYVMTYARIPQLIAEIAVRLDRFEGRRPADHDGRAPADRHPARPGAGAPHLRADLPADRRLLRRRSRSLRHHDGLQPLDRGHLATIRSRAVRGNPGGEGQARTGDRAS